MKKRFFLFIILLITLSFTAACADGFSGDPDAVEKAVKSVMMLKVMRDNNVIATGSGFVAFDNKTLVTNYHVIEDADIIFAQSDDGHEYIIMQICIADKEKDLAILSFYSPTDLQPLPLHTAVDQKRIESVVAIGSPRGLKNTVSTGNISAVFKEDGTQWLQFTAPISNGSSGGALFNDNGEVIGVTSMIRKDSQNINFAIHAKEVQDLYVKWDSNLTFLTDICTPSPTPTSTPSPTPRPTVKTTPTVSKTEPVPSISSVSFSKVTATSMTIKWTATNSSEYLLYYKKASSSEWTSLGRSKNNQRSFINLTPNTEYSFKVVAIDAKGNQSAPYLRKKATLKSSIPSYLWPDDYKYGTESLNILLIKTEMQAYGYYTANADLSLTYNAIMVERIKLFQMNNGLKVTGNIDYEFLEKLYSGSAVRTNQFN